MLEFLTNEDVSWVLRHEMGFAALENSAFWARLLAVQALSPLFLLAGVALTAPVATVLGDKNGAPLRGGLLVLFLVFSALLLPALTALTVLLGIEATTGAWVDPPVLAGLAAVAAGGLLPFGVLDRQGMVHAKGPKADLLGGLLYPAVSVGAYLYSLGDAAIFRSGAAVAVYGLLVDLAVSDAGWWATVAVGTAFGLAALGLAPAGLAAAWTALGALTGGE